MSKIQKCARGRWLFSHFSSFSFWRGPLRVVCRQEPTDIDQIVGDPAQAHPTLHPGIPAIATTIQSVASFEHANATFHSRSPLLASSEGALLLMSSSFGALCGAVRNRNLLHTHLAQFCLVARGVEPCVTSHQLPNTPELLFVFLPRRHQEVGIIGPLGEHLVMGDDLILRFLNFYHLP